jgi:3-oxoacyl-[acyl-carrier-protein] synthase-1
MALAWILTTGARGPLGLCSMQVAMCARARKSEPRASAVLDRRRYPIGHCRALGLPDQLAGHDRLLALAAPALREAWPRGLAEAVPLVLALPEAGRADDDPRLAGGVIGALAVRSGALLDPTRSAVIRAGHAGGALAFEAAAALLASPVGPPMVIVGGVDSHAHPGVLAALDREDRLHAPGVEDGFIPGEGAAFLLLARRPDHLAGSRPLAALRRVATSREVSAAAGEPSHDGAASGPKPRAPAEPNLARALTEVVRAASDDGKVGWVLHDVNGESHRVREWSMAETRVLSGREAVSSRFADELGDIGAATGPTLATIACCFWATGCAPASDALVVLSSDGPDRGAFCLEVAP